MDDVTGKGRGGVGPKHSWRETLSGPALAPITALANMLAQFLSASPVGRGQAPGRSGAIHPYSSHQEKRPLFLRIGGRTLIN